MKQEPLISVIVPVYNVAQYLDTCLESIVGQTYRNLEILVVDDGSTDDSGTMCDRWAGLDERIRVIHQPNGGLSAARNTALDVMRGDVVTMVDSDDLLHPHFIEVLLHLLQRHEADIAVGGYNPFYGDKPDLPEEMNEHDAQLYDRDEALTAILYQDKLTHSAWGRLYKASVFNEVRYPVGKLYEDLAVIYPLLKNASTIVRIDTPLYGYRQREASILQTFSERRAAVLDICEELEHTMQNDDPQYLPAVRSRLLSAYFNILLLSHQDKTNDHSQLADRCWQGIKRLRWGCLTDKNMRGKNKMGILASLPGRRFLCDVAGHHYQPKP